MAEITGFGRCIYCFTPKKENGPCRLCGYEPGACDLPAQWLQPGSVLRGRFIIGKNLARTDDQIVYLGWDLVQEKTVDIVEYYPKALVTRDITHSETVVTVPGCEDQVEQGRQKFFERAKLFYQCVSRVEDELLMDFFIRNNTCYYILRRQQRVKQ